MGFLDNFKKNSGNGDAFVEVTLEILDELDGLLISLSNYRGIKEKDFREVISIIEDYNNKASRLKDILSKTRPELLSGSSKLIFDNVSSIKSADDLGRFLNSVLLSKLRTFEELKKNVEAGIREYSKAS